MNLIELTSLTNETFLINLDHVAAIREDMDFSEGTRYSTIMLSSGQFIPISEADFHRITCQLTNQYSISVIED